MKNGIHFISGLPRSGSTLLSAILRQNPKVHAHITSPVGSLLLGALHEMSAAHEGSVFMDEARRKPLSLPITWLCSSVSRVSARSRPGRGST